MKQVKESISILTYLFLFTNVVYGMMSGVSIKYSGNIFIGHYLLLFITLVAFIFYLADLPRYGIDNNVLKYFFLISVVITILTVNLLYFGVYIDTSNKDLKELIRLLSYVFIIMALSNTEINICFLRRLSNYLVLLGLLISYLCIQHSLYGESEKTWLYYEGYLRAGTGLVDSNTLSGALNLFSSFSVFLFIYNNNFFKKIYYVFTFLFIQAGRFFTLSTGGTISLIIFIFLVMFFSSKQNRTTIKNLFIIFFVFIIFTSIFIIFSKYDKFILYRLFLSDDTIKTASIYSRVDQYKNYYDLLKNDIHMLLIGYGPSYFTLKLKTGLDMHNSFLRTIGVGGFIYFIIFIYIWNDSRSKLIKLLKSRNVGLSTFGVIIISSYISWSIQALTIPADLSIVTWFFFILAQSRFSDNDI